MTFVFLGNRRQEKTRCVSSHGLQWIWSSWASSSGSMFPGQRTNPCVLDQRVSVYPGRTAAEEVRRVSIGTEVSPVQMFPGLKYVVCGSPDTPAAAWSQVMEEVTLFKALWDSSWLQVSHEAHRALRFIVTPPD